MDSWNWNGTSQPQIGVQIVPESVHQILQVHWVSSKNHLCKIMIMVGTYIKNHLSPLFSQVHWCLYNGALKTEGGTQNHQTSHLLDASGWFQMVLECQHDETTKQRLPWLPSVQSINQLWPHVTVVRRHWKNQWQWKVWIFVGLEPSTWQTTVYQTDWMRVSVRWVESQTLRTALQYEAPRSPAQTPMAFPSLCVSLHCGKLARTLTWRPSTY